MAGLLIAAVVLVVVIALVVWLSLGRDAFEADTGPDDDPRYIPPSGTV